MTRLWTDLPCDVPECRVLKGDDIMRTEEEVRAMINQMEILRKKHRRKWTDYQQRSLFYRAVGIIDGLKWWLEEIELGNVGQVIKKETT